MGVVEDQQVKYRIRNRTVDYTLRDGSSGCADQISQKFNATAGQIYIVSFWLRSGSTGTTVLALVTLS